MILTAILIPPPLVCPSITVDGSAMGSEDDPTYTLGNAIKASANVQRCELEGASTCVIFALNRLSIKVALRLISGIADDNAE